MVLNRGHMAPKEAVPYFRGGHRQKLQKTGAMDTVKRATKISLLKYNIK
jgi:hypothetical protein